jgi:hypothetical protein
VLPTQEFYGRRWNQVAFVLILGLISAIFLYCGVLFLTGVWKPQIGRKGWFSNEGILVLGCLSIVAFMASVARLIQLRSPTLRLSPLILEVQLRGRSSLDHLPFVPLVVHILWSFLSLQVFRVELIHIPWTNLRFAEVRKHKFLDCYSLVLGFERVDDALGFPGVDFHGSGEIALEQVSLATQVDECANEIQARLRDSIK